MTEAELKSEFDYRISERLGILCADAEPTPEQFHIARTEADAAIEDIKRLESLERIETAARSQRRNYALEKRFGKGAI